MVKCVVGVDPGGSSGGYVILSEGRISSMDIFYKSENPELALILVLKRLGNNIKSVFLEKAQPFRGEGVKSVFSYAQHFGQLEGALKALEIPYVLVPPKAWQKEMFLGTPAEKHPKERALLAANRLFPATDFRASERCKKQHPGLIDASLIALWGYRNFLASVGAS